MSTLQNKIALVTGGGSGIGLATVRLFLENGASVAVVGRDAAKLKANTKNFPNQERLLLEPADVADPDQVKTLVGKVLERFGRIDILVNNAGTNVKNRTFRELTPAIWQLLLRTNLDGAFYCIYEVLPQMLKRKDGLIININSIAGKRASPLGGVAYAASKFGMTALTHGLATEEKDSGIRVTSIFPGEVDTPILEFRPTPVSADQRKSILRPEDVASAVLFVASQPQHVHIPELIIKPVVQAYF